MSSDERPEYAVGQVWSYETRPGEEGSLVHIARIDEGLADEPIFHIRITGLMLKNPRMEGSYQRELPHSPVGKATLDSSVVAVVESGGPPDISGGYAHWRLEFDRQAAGFFTIPVKQIVQSIEDIANGQR